MQEENKIFLNDSPNDILYMNFNQDGSCIAIGTETGFKIINTYPFIDLYYKDMNGGIGIIEMLNKSNILALVGGGKNPKYPINELILYDEERNEEIIKIKTKMKILNIKLRENKIYIVNAEKVLVFDFNTLNLIESLETKNIRGLISICYKEDILAYPDINHEGTIRIKNYDTNKENVLKAHKTPLCLIQLNQDGTMIGTSSLKGTLIRVYNISTGQLIREVRRGVESANVNFICFDISQKYFIVLSDKKTVHVFFLINNNITENHTNNQNGNRNSNEYNEKNEINNTVTDIDNKKSIFEGMSNFFNVGKRYFGSEWSFSRYRLNSPKSIAIFGHDNTIILATYDGKYYQIGFDPINGGECIKIQEEKF